MRVAISPLAALLLCAPAFAQVPPALLACTGEVDDRARLACYDTAMKGLSADARKRVESREVEARKAQEAAAVAAAAAAATAAAAAEAERKAGFGKPTAAAEDVQSVDATITEVLRDAAGKAVFVLSNGQIWRQADGFKLPNAKVGTAVTVRRGALGSYRLTPADSNRSAQVVRMR